MKKRTTRLSFLLERLTRQRGQSLVELALTMTLILTLLAGAVDLGSAFFSYIAIRDAAQEGAIYGSIDPTNIPGIANRVRTSSTTPIDLTDPAKVTISVGYVGACDGGGVGAGGGIRVSVVYTYHISMPFIGTILGSQTIPLTASVTDTILRPPCPP